MSVTFTETLKQRFAGQLSDGERAVCSNFKTSFTETLAGKRSFEAEMMLLWDQLRKLRKFNFDVEAAIDSGEFDPVTDQSLSAIPAHASTEELTEKQRDFLEDASGLIEWAVRNGVRFTLVLEVLGHDIGEISHHQFSLEKTLGDYIMPKVTGWAKRNLEPVGEADEPAV